MDRLERSERAGGEPPTVRPPVYALEEWRAAGRPARAAVRVAADIILGADYACLAAVECIVIEFPGFMDGRGFSHARKLRQLGFAGELLADGDLIADQWAYLERCGFSGLVSPELAERTTSLVRVSEGYQSDSLQPEPLFRRRVA